MKNKKKIIKKKFGVDFFSDGGALTLSSGEVCNENEDATGFHERKHKDGWKISGVIQEDYYSWVNDFKANHPKYGRVWGNFEATVYATSERAFKHFYKYHTPLAWDYYEI